MKTTIDLPDEVLYRAKVVAAQRRTTLKALFLSALELALKPEGEDTVREAAMARLRRGFRLGGKPLERDQVYARR